MELVLLTALGVGGATVIGALVGFIFKNVTHKFTDIVLSFASGVMLSAAILGLTTTQDGAIVAGRVLPSPPISIFCSPSPPTSQAVSRRSATNGESRLYILLIAISLDYSF